MRIAVASALFTVVLAGTRSVELPAGVPGSVREFREKHPYVARAIGSRRSVAVRASTSDDDDVSDDFLKALREANNGGTLYLPKGSTYIIGKPLDLTFLNDVHVNLDGEIKFTNDTAYWQKHAFRHPFQNSIMFWKWGGNNTRIYGGGTLNGNGQRFWNEFSGLEILDPSNTYLRPILFYAENATNLSVEGIHMKDSPCWTTFIVTCEHGRGGAAVVEVEKKPEADLMPSQACLVQGHRLYGPVQQSEGAAQEHGLLRLAQRRARFGRARLGRHWR